MNLYTFFLYLFKNILLGIEVSQNLSTCTNAEFYEVIYIFFPQIWFGN